MTRRRASRAVWVVLAAALLISGACSQGAPTAPEGEAPSTTVSWQEAASHIGEQAAVEGPVVDAHFAQASKGQPTFLNLGKPYPDPERFTVVIWSENRNRFPEPPEALYRGKTIRVVGTISQYQGRAEIVVEGPEDVEIVE